MIKQLIFSLLPIIIIGCQNEEEFDIGIIPGEYTGSAYYSSTGEIGGVPLISTDPSKGGVFKTVVQKVGSNFVLSFDQSFNYTIPDITVEIAATEYSYIVAIKTLPDQAFSSVKQDQTYRNQPNNAFSYTDYVRRADLQLTLKSNDPDSISAITIIMLRLY